MTIVITPMCEEILKLLNIKDYIVNKEPDTVPGAELAIVLSETQTEIPSIKLKLNTFHQIQESLRLIAKHLKIPDIDLENAEKTISYSFKWANTELKDQYRQKNKNIRVKVYSNFLKDIVMDMGYNVIETNPDFIIYPDYIENSITIPDNNNINILKIPSHTNVPLNPIERVDKRYELLETKLCMKH